MSREECLALLSTTTTDWLRVRGFSIELLHHLRDKQLLLCELCELTGKDPNTVNRYLYNLRKYGYVQKDDHYYKITEVGVALLNIHNIHNIHVYTKYERNMKGICKKYESSMKVERDSKRASLRQTGLELWLQSCDLSEKEKEVVEVLIDHYNKTGSKYLYFDNPFDFAERFKISPQMATEVLKRLKQDGIIYVFRDRQLGSWKIGLKSAFLEALKLSQ